MAHYLITGGAGFIGSHFIRHLLMTEPDATVTNMDMLTYAGDVARIADIATGGRYTFLKADIAEPHAVQEAFKRGVDIVIHFAAESHVDRSIEDSLPFEASNVRGTLNLLDAARKAQVKRFVHISTDEVYGELGEQGTFTESTPFAPNSPYSASKASGDLFVRAYHHTHKLPVVIIRPSNNYGPWQYPEKLIPVVIHRALENKPVPVYAQGLNIREWLYVEDCARGVYAAMQNGVLGEAYNIGSGNERRNIEVVKGILSLLGKPESLIEFVKDRPGHDFRYSLDASKIKRETGWQPQVAFQQGLERTVKWYVDNQPWWRQFV